MENRSSHSPPQRISDLVALKEGGAAVTCSPTFHVVPVDFRHRDNPYRAHVFMCRFSGAADREPYGFRKCYARGCSHNLCPHVSQAVMIANRYLHRDYQRLKQVGIHVEERLFTLEDMLVKFEDVAETPGPTLALEDYIQMAREDNDVLVNMDPEHVPAVEHFSNFKNSQTFLTGHFSITTQGNTSYCDRFFACYPTEKEAEEKAPMIQLANVRLEELYREFDGVGVRYEKRFFA